MAGPAGFTKASAERTLVVDDDPGINRRVTALLGGEKMEVASAAISAEALDAPRRDPRDLVLVDASPADVGAEIRSRSPDAAVILMTGLGTQGAAAKVLRLGAEYDLHQLFAGHDFRAIVRGIMERIRRIFPPGEVFLPALLSPAELGSSTGAELGDSGRPLGSDLRVYARPDELAVGDVGLRRVCPLANCPAPERMGDSRITWIIEKQFES